MKRIYILLSILYTLSSCKNMSIFTEKQITIGHWQSKYKTIKIAKSDLVTKRGTTSG